MQSTYQIAVVLSLCVMMLFVASCYDDPFEHSKCTMSATNQIPSPDDKYKVAIYEYSCRPETQKILRTQVELVQASQSYSPISEVIFVIDGKHTVNTAWLSATSLQIECLDVGDSSIRSRHDKWGEIDISYKLK